MTRTNETIAAIATAAGRSSIGIVRVSGPSLADFAENLTGRRVSSRQVVVTAFCDGAGALIDRGIALYFKAPQSYTGEDVLELHGHGGPVVLRMLLQRCVELGARVAEPGEFTRRAFLNGKLDLAQAEGVIDLIDASTAQAARCALRSLQGDFSARIEVLRVGLTALRALLEATLDFPEDDLDPVDRVHVSDRLHQLQTDIKALTADAQQGSLLREGIRIVLVGEPNVGKSSLLNRLAGEEIAIVTEIAGTTRDLVRQVVDIDGIPAHIIDTAGLRDPTDSVERIGIERAWQAIGSADAVIVLVDASSGKLEPDATILDRLPARVPRLRVVNKIDLVQLQPRLQVHEGESVAWVSAKTGEGVPLLRTAITTLIGWRGAHGSVFLARERHLEALRKTRDHLERAAQQHNAQELCAEELRLAHTCISTITGQFTSNDLLGEIFSRFCIGK